MKIILYFDEDAQDSDLIRALDLRGVGILGAWAAGMRERSDEEHLIAATAQNRTVYSFNVRDYCRLHGEFLAQGRSHAGIILDKQQHYSVGEQMRRLLKLIATKPAEEMTNNIEFLRHGNDRCVSKIKEAERKD